MLSNQETNHERVKNLLNEISVQSAYLCKLDDVLQSELENQEGQIAISMVSNLMVRHIGWLADMAQAEMKGTPVVRVDAESWLLHEDLRKPKIDNVLTIANGDL